MVLSQASWGRCGNVSGAFFFYPRYKSVNHKNSFETIFETTLLGSDNESRLELLFIRKRKWSVISIISSKIRCIVCTTSKQGAVGE